MLMKNVFLLLVLVSFFCRPATAQVVDTSQATIRYLDSLMTLTWNQTNKKKFDEAIKNGEAGRQFALENVSNQHASYASAVFTLGRAYHAAGKYDQAEPLYQEALMCRERIYGKQHLEYVIVVTKIGTLYSETGKYQQALSYLLESKSTTRILYGKNDREYVITLVNLAILYNKLAEYEAAEKLYLEAVEIQEAVLGKDTPEYVATLNNLGSLYQSMGKYEQAEVCARQSLTIRKKQPNSDPTKLASNLANYASLLLRLGRFQEALELLLESKSVMENANSTETTQYSYVLTNLGRTYRKLNQFEAGEKYLQEALTLKQKLLGPDNPEIASTLNNLGTLFEEKKDFERSLEYHLRAKQIREKAFGINHPDYAISLSSLGELYFKQLKWEKALEYLLESRAIHETVHGPDHPEYAYVANQVARCYLALGRKEEARALFEPLMVQQTQQFLKTRRHSSLEELSAYMDVIAPRADDFYSFLWKTGHQTATGTCYDYLLFKKGFLLESTLKIKNIAEQDSSTSAQLLLLQATMRQLTKEYAKPLKTRKNTQELETQANELEKQLAQSVAGYENLNRQVTWQEVQTALSPGEAALEIIRFDYYAPYATDSVLYAALLLKPGTTAPVFQPLFEEKQLNALLNTGSGNLNSDQINELYRSTDLYQLLWSPLEKHLKNVKTVYVSPDGLLHRINLPALPNSAKTILSDQYDIVALGSTRSLVTDANMPFSKPKNATLYGGIQFEPDSLLMVAAAGQSDVDTRQLQNNPDRNQSWNYLRWSARETDNITGLLNKAGISAALRTDTAGTEESFKQIGQGATSPDLLHVCTHGFFFPNPEVKENDNDLVFKVSNHPMMRAGLILAGANYAWKTGNSIKHREDGILTALEISQLNLRQTELVVLSACETGLGDLADDEGVYGLQRAFKIAGAKTLVMSLWQVPDYQTQELMTLFYQNLLDRNTTPRQALRAAQNDLRRKHYEPFYWAGFVIVE